VARRVPAVWTATAPADALAARLAGVAAAVDRVLPGWAGSDDAREAATLARRAAEAVDVAGRPLAAANTGVGWPDKPHLVLWQALTTLREHRGDGHLAACVSAGLSGLEANLLTEMRVGWEPLAYTATRGWSPEAMAAATERLTRRGLIDGSALTEAGSALRDGIEETTDRLVQPVVDAIGDDLTGLVERLDGWARQIVDAGWFPPDPYKRASG
jgi:hypothetical protein